MGMLIARFRAPEPLTALRKAVWRTCREHGISFPDALWVPHVVLGKVVATKAQLTNVSLGNLSPLAPTLPSQALGLTLLGEKPPDSPAANWDLPALTFTAVESCKGNLGVNAKTASESLNVHPQACELKISKPSG